MGEPLQRVWALSQQLQDRFGGSDAAEAHDVQQQFLRGAGNGGAMTVSALSPSLTTHSRSENPWATPPRKAPARASNLGDSLPLWEVSKASTSGVKGGGEDVYSGGVFSLTPGFGSASSSSSAPFHRPKGAADPVQELVRLQDEYSVLRQKYQLAQTQLDQMHHTTTHGANEFGDMDGKLADLRNVCTRTERELLLTRNDVLEREIVLQSMSDFLVQEKWLEIEGMQELSQPEIKERVMTILDEMITVRCESEGSLFKKNERFIGWTERMRRCYNQFISGISTILNADMLSEGSLSVRGSRGSSSRKQLRADELAASMGEVQGSMQDISKLVRDVGAQVMSSQQEVSDRLLERLSSVLQETHQFGARERLAGQLEEEVRHSQDLISQLQQELSHAKAELSAFQEREFDAGKRDEELRQTVQKVVGLQQEYDDLQNELQLANEDRRKTSNAADQLRERVHEQEELIVLLRGELQKVSSRLDDADWVLRDLGRVMQKLDIKAPLSRAGSAVDVASMITALRSPSSSNLRSSTSGSSGTSVGGAVPKVDAALQQKFKTIREAIQMVDQHLGEVQAKDRQLVEENNRLTRAVDVHEQQARSLAELKHTMERLVSGVETSSRSHMEMQQEVEWLKRSSSQLQSEHRQLEEAVHSAHESLSQEQLQREKILVKKLEHVQELLDLESQGTKSTLEKLLGEVHSMEQAFQERDEQIAGAERRYQELMQEVEESKKRSKEQWSRMESEFGKVSGESQSQRQVLESVQQHLRTLHQGLEVIRHEELQENNHLKSEIEHMHSNIRQRERSLLDLRQQHEELTQRLKQDSSEHSHQVEILQQKNAQELRVKEQELDDLRAELERLIKANKKLEAKLAKRTENLRRVLSTLEGGSEEVQKHLSEVEGLRKDKVFQSADSDSKMAPLKRSSTFSLKRVFSPAGSSTSSLVGSNSSHSPTGLSGSGSTPSSRKPLVSSRTQPALSIGDLNSTRLAFQQQRGGPGSPHASSHTATSLRQALRSPSGGGGAL